MKLFSSALLTTLALSLAQGSAQTPTVWSFTNPADWTAAEPGGAATLSVFDPGFSDWFVPADNVKSASDLGLPPVPGNGGAAKRVLHFPACTPAQGFHVAHTAASNGSYGDQGLVSNYTLIYDILYPVGSDGKWRALHQTNTANNDDAEFYIRNSASGGVGISSNYLGSITPGVWHRIVTAVSASTGDRWKIQRFVDGTFVGGQNGADDALRWALQPEFLLFTEDNNETAEGYVSSIAFVPRLMTMSEITALGGPGSAGALTPGGAAAPVPNQPDRSAKIIGHRGNSGAAPEDTLVSLQQAITEGASAMEFDVRLTADGVVVGMHDDLLDRTTDGSGSVSGYTLAELKLLDAGAWFGSAYIGEKIPTLEEMLTAAKGKLTLYLDLKQTGMGPAVKAALAASGYPESDLWLWTYDQSLDAGGDAAALHALMPQAKLVFGDLTGWQTPGFFTDRAALGVGIFDVGAGNGVLDRKAVAAAKSAGFKVSAFTIMDPGAMETAINNGVDYFETDFISTARSIIPVPAVAKATRPFPAQAAASVVSPGFLSWLPGTAAVNHRVHFGTQNPPPFIGAQAHDVYDPGTLLPGTTYYWRIDEQVSGGGITTGDVWSFTMAGTPQSLPWEWTFDGDTPAPAIGSGLLEWSTPEARAEASYALTDGTVIPHIDGTPAGYLKLPGYVNPSDFPMLTFNGTVPNGGGAYLNQFTFLMDVYIPGPHAWLPFFNTNPANANDADWYVTPDGSLGIQALVYSPAGTVETDKWQRVIFSADLGNGVVTMYVNGVQVAQRTGASLLDGRFSMYSSNDAGPDVLIGNEGDTNGLYTREWLLSSLAFLDRTLSAAEAAQLGSPRAPGIYVTGPTGSPVLTISRSGAAVNLQWNQPGLLLQRSGNLSAWTPVPGSTAVTSFSESAGAVPSFFRLAQP